MSDLVERLREQLASDHIRGCMGRQYHCDCGYDAKTEGLLQTAADRIEALEAALEACITELEFYSRVDWRSPEGGRVSKFTTNELITKARAALAPEQGK